MKAWGVCTIYYCSTPSSYLFILFICFVYLIINVFIMSACFSSFSRSTAFGVQSVFGRIGAILGNLAFGKLISYNPMYPILIVAVFLALGGLSAVFLPTLPGEGAIQRIKNIKRKCLCCVLVICHQIQRIRK